MNTTLNKIREKLPCTEGWKKLLTNLGKTKADDEAISILTILDSTLSSARKPLNRLPIGCCYGY